MIYIRKFNERDAESCSRMINEIIDHIFSKNYSKEHCAFLRESNSAEALSKKALTSYAIVAQKENSVVGMAFLQGNYISKVYVAIEVQGKGLGKLLMRTLEKIAKTKGHRETILDSFLNSVGFYKKIGYQEIPEQSLNQGIKVIRMKKFI